MGKELREPRARGWMRQEAGFTQFLILKGKGRYLNDVRTEGGGC